MVVPVQANHFPGLPNAFVDFGFPGFLSTCLPTVHCLQVYKPLWLGLIILLLIAPFPFVTRHSGLRGEADLINCSHHLTRDKTIMQWWIINYAHNGASSGQSLPHTMAICVLNNPWAVNQSVTVGIKKNKSSGIYCSENPSPQKSQEAQAPISPKGLGLKQ